MENVWGGFISYFPLFTEGCSTFEGSFNFYLSSINNLEFCFTSKLRSQEHKIFTTISGNWGLVNVQWYPRNGFLWYEELAGCGVVALAVTMAWHSSAVVCAAANHNCLIFYQGSLWDIVKSKNSIQSWCSKHCLCHSVLKYHKAHHGTLFNKEKDIDNWNL